MIERVRARTEIDQRTGCWLWTGALANGYGRISWSLGDNQMTWAAVHRVMYEAEVGPIPQGLDLDHLCHDPGLCHPDRAVDCPHRRCWRPDHLEPATRQTNLLRGGTIAARRAAIERCPQGHPYDEGNTIIDKLGRRSCRTCAYERNRAYYWANREKRREYNREWRRRRSGGEGSAEGG